MVFNHQKHSVEPSKHQLSVHIITVIHVIYDVIERHSFILCDMAITHLELIMCNLIICTDMFTVSYVPVSY